VSGISGSMATTVCAETVAMTAPDRDSTSEAVSAGAVTSTPVTSPASTSEASTSGVVPPQSSSVPAWLPWTFAGLSGATALTSLVAWRLREHHVERYNSAACLQTGKTRVQACSDEYYAGRDAEAIAWVAGIGSVAFLGSALFLGQTGASVSASASAVSFKYSGAF
jgi:hypothetical protein